MKSTKLKGMKRITSVMLVCLLTLALGIAAFAEEGRTANEGQTITTQVREDGTTVTTVDNGNGRVFTVEEMPEYGNDEILPAPTAPEPTEAARTEPSAPANGAEPASSGLAAAARETAENAGSSGWLIAALAALIAAGVTAAVLTRRKKKA